MSFSRMASQLFASTSDSSAGTFRRAEGPVAQTRPAMPTSRLAGRNGRSSNPFRGYMGSCQAVQRSSTAVVTAGSKDQAGDATAPGGTRTGSSSDMDKWFYSENGQKQWVDAMELNTEELPQLLIDLGVRYDPDRLAAALSNRSMEINARALKVSVSLGGFVTSLLQDYAFGRLEANMDKRANELRRILGGLGPSFVKVGQALSSRPDLLPKPYLEALSVLQDRLPSFPSSIAYSVIEEELGQSVQELYSELTPEPVAAASLGQVYKGVLRSTGEQVAVKVQRPGIGENIAIDMLLLRRLLGAVDRNVTFLTQPLVPLVDEFAARLFGELDYVEEGRSAEKFQELYGGLPNVRTPAIKWEATARRVLTMEWIEGVKLTDEAAMAAAGLDVIEFVDIGIECTLRQLLEHGYFHADPHPGNLLATPTGLVYLDFGMMSSAPEYARYAIIQHVTHLVNKDYAAMCRDYYTLQFVDESVDTSPIAPALAAFFDDVLGNSVSQLNFKAIVDGLGEVLFQYPFSVPPYYALILRSLTVLEGLALSADPQYKLLAKAYPYMARRILMDPAPELRASLEELVLDQAGRFRWARLDNLVREGSKSAEFEAEDMWLLAEWVLSENGTPVRGPIVNEAVKLLDAVFTDGVRRQVAAASGSAELAARLVPEQPGEADARGRVQLLAKLAGAPDDLLAPPAPALAGGVPAGGGVPAFGLLPRLPGLPPVAGLGDASVALAQLQGRALEAWPRLRQLAERPGAAEAAAQLQRGLSQRFAARTVKFVAGAVGGAEQPPPKRLPRQRVV